MRAAGQPFIRSRVITHLWRFPATLSPFGPFFPWHVPHHLILQFPVPGEGLHLPDGAASRRLIAEERGALLAGLRKRDFDANHHCSAWRQGVPVTAQGSDDDGEPSGTAGAPMLRVLEGEHLTDLLAVCLRWFGGTKLGTGGLGASLHGGRPGRPGRGPSPGTPGRGAGPPPRDHRRAAGAGASSLATLGAFPEAEVLGQEFGPGGAVVRFQIPPGREGALEAAWRERSRGGAIQWD